LKLENYLIQTLQIDSETVHLICQYFEKSSYNSSDLLLKEGEGSNKIFFIEKGLAREFSSEETATTADLHQTNWFIKENGKKYWFETKQLICIFLQVDINP
jgi:hypothetical protein